MRPFIAFVFIVFFLFPTNAKDLEEIKKSGKIRIRAIEAQKNRLEQLVRERTQELEVANIEIEAQRDLATMQRDKISHQKKEIEDSIYYAQRIQQSLLPSKEFLDQLRNEIIQALGQRGAESESKDGMDMALCIIDREEGDALYIFSDGYSDQADILEKTMADWQGILEQIDDMVIIGIRI